MAKKSDDKPGEKKAKKRRIPKEIAGVKIPKDLRRQGEALIDAANSPAGRTLLLSGLATVVTSAMAKAARPAPPLAAPPPAPTATPDAASTSSQGGTTRDPTEAGAEAARKLVDALTRMFDKAG